MFDFKFLRGNPKTALEDPGSAVITRTFARKLFGDSVAVGKTIVFDNFVFTVSGILEKLPENSIFDFDMLVSYNLRTKIFPNWDQRWWHGGVYTFFIPQNPELLPAIQKKLSEIPDKYYPEWLDKDVDYIARPMKKSHLYNWVRGDMKSTVSPAYLYILLTIAMTILALACINYINFATVYSTRRRKSIGINKIYGAQPRSLFIQQITESVLFSTISFGFALIISEQLLPLFAKITGKQFNFDYSNLSLLSGIILFSFIVGILSGLYPGIVFSRKKPVEAFLLKSHGKIERTLLHKSSVIIQFLISLILIIAATCILKQTSFMKNYNVGFDKNNLYAIYLDDLGTDSVKYENAKLYRQEVEKFAGQYGFSNGTITENIPGFYYQNSFEIVPDGFTKENSIRITSTAIDENFLKVYGIKMTEGRFFSWDYPTDYDAFIINETALKMFGWDNITGKYINLVYDSKKYPVIGVMKDIHISSLQNNLGPVLFRFGEHNNFPGFLTIRMAKDKKQETVRFLEKTWEKLFPDVTFSGFFVKDKYLDNYKSEDKLIRIILIFTLLAIILSCLGLFSLVSYETMNRTKEIGIRKVNGAGTGKIMLMLSKDFTKWVLVAFIIACLVGYFAMNKWLQNFAYKTDLSWWIFALAGLLTYLIALLTASWQSWRAASRNPVEALRYE